ncbi:uncharacterized protein HMPREF1541_03761 [Cyphellophora europaea CBS 101466]|uniref:Uncharacterized protein n=1 Tax=Cyphellophora europaea (strain CBS 101466) TaxID=1220924 RepID=W2S1I3_CYPE1|nr:uncharacterized protein HMPREF1541_03761 [Cyphellophora europaea CBS 101466]ETN41824.1 hypothetical protein HMPREF1541_03761 [Cyphellophora europaea CBS 101466]
MEAELSFIREDAMADNLSLDKNLLCDLAAVGEEGQQCFVIMKEGRVVSKRLAARGSKLIACTRKPVAS